MKNEESLPWSIVLQAEIAKRAYELWEAGGRVHGHDVSHWLQAEAEIVKKSERPASNIDGRILTSPEFRQLVDAGGQAAEEIAPTLHSALQQASQENSQKIRENCPKSFAHLFHGMRQIKKGLVAEYVLKGLSLEPYYAIAAAIQDCLRKTEKAPENHLEAPNWSEIIRLGKRRCKLHPNAYRPAEGVLRQTESRAFALSDAAHRLRDRGYSCDVKDSAPFFSDSERRRIVSQIEERIETLGALGIINNLCRILRPNYSNQMQRYLMPSKLDAIGRTASSSLPVNFLLQLALKKVQAPRDAPLDAQEQWTDLIALATDFAAIYDTEPFSHWELEFIDAHTLISYIVDLALHDRLFGLRQYRAADVGKVLRGLFDWVTSGTEAAIGWSVTEACSVAEAVLRRAKVNGLSVFTTGELQSQCGNVAPVKVTQILGAFTHEQNPNSESDLPEIPKKLNFFLKPLMRLDANRLIMVDRAMCAPAFYEAVAAALRPHEPQIQSKIGLAAERFLIAEMRRKGVSVSSGTYQSSEGDGECDAVIETSDTIVFFELKGKPLTSASQAGSDVDILFDLLKSLFDATFQANRHDIVLRKDGQIELSQSDGTKYRLELNGRQTEKVAVTLLDFGRFQDRTVLTQILETLLTATVTPYDPKLNADFQKLNRKTTALRAQILELSKLDPNPPPPFFNCWFLSIPQLLVLLDRVNSNESLKAELWQTRHFSTHSLDWYTEMDAALKLRRSA